MERKHGLPSIWFQHLTQGDPEKKENFEKTVRTSTVALQRLYDILGDYLETIAQDELSPSFFEKANLAERIAYNRGRMRELTNLKNIINGVLQNNE